LIREFIERIEGVNQTWFELEIEGSSRKKTLVVEVGFASDVDGTHDLRAACDEIERTYRTLIGEENADAVSKLKIINKSAGSGEKQFIDKPTGAKQAPTMTAVLSGRPTQVRPDPRDPAYASGNRAHQCANKKRPLRGLSLAEAV
jgi:hypothetical protein